MEIIHLILGKANPERMNGVNKVVFQLATEQAASGRKVAVWGITKDTVHNYGPRTFETRLFPAQSNPFSIHSSLKAALLEKKDRVVVHLHGGWVPTYAPVSHFLREQQIPYVITPHGAYNTIAMKRSALRKKIYFTLFEHRLLRGAKRIHSIGQSEVSGLQSFFPNEKSLLLPYGFTSAGNAPRALLASGVFTIGFVGRLDIYTKGLDLLLEAFASFQATGIPSALWILGDSKERDTLAQQIREKGLQDKVILWGSKFGQEKIDIMQQMHVFAHPSRNEGLPASVLEAAQMGIPCVVSRATNVAECIEQYGAGVAVPDEDVQALAGAFSTLALQWIGGKLAATGENATIMVEEAFNWNRIVTGFDQLYN